MGSKAEASAFLETQPKTASAKALADALHWAASLPADEAHWQEMQEDRSSFPGDQNIAHGLPEGSHVSMLFANNENEDNTWRDELEGTGLAGNFRQLDFNAPFFGSNEFAEAV